MMDRGNKTFSGAASGEFPPHPFLFKTKLSTISSSYPGLLPGCTNQRAYGVSTEPGERMIACARQQNQPGCIEGSVATAP